MTQNGDRLAAGEAQAWALASIAETGSSPGPPWSLETHLVSDVVAATAAR